MHRGAAPERRPLPDYLVPLGRTVGLPINGAVSNLALSSQAVGTLGRELRTRRLRRGPRARAQRAVRELVRHRGRARPAGGHLPLLLAQPALQRLRRQRGRRAPALQQAATCGSRCPRPRAGPAERFYGGRYRIVPNGVDLAAARPSSASGAGTAGAAVRRPRRGPQGPARAAARLRGAAQRRGAAPGSPWPAPPRRRSQPLLLDPEGVRVAGRVTEEEKWRLLGAGRPAVRAVAGRRELRHGAHRGVRVIDARRGLRHRRLPRRGAHGDDGLLVPAADPAALGEALRDLALDPGPARARWPRPRASTPSASPGRT